MKKMSYMKISELPVNVKKELPKRAQEVFRKAYNSALDEYDYTKERWVAAAPEEVAKIVAWIVVKDKYKIDRKGKWVKKN